MTSRFFWYIPNQHEAGHRGDVGRADHNSLAALAEQAHTIEEHGWQGALIGTSWGRPDTLTVATALTAVTRRFQPLVAIRPGYWAPAQFASAAATLDHLGGGQRLLVNIVSGHDAPAAYGDNVLDPAARYQRTRAFMGLVRQFWQSEQVDHTDAFYQLSGARLTLPDGFVPPPLYFGGASAQAEHVAAAAADVQLFWGESLAGVAERIDRLKNLARTMDRNLPPLQFGLRITTLIRNTREEAWAVATRKVDAMKQGWQEADWVNAPVRAVGQQRLVDLTLQGDVLDSCLYTAPARFGGGGAASTWLVGTAQDVADALQRYEALGVSHFILSDTPYRNEAMRQGAQLLPLLKKSFSPSGRQPENGAIKV